MLSSPRCRSARRSSVRAWRNASASPPGEAGHDAAARVDQVLAESHGTSLPRGGRAGVITEQAPEA